MCNFKDRSIGAVSFVLVLLEVTLFNIWAELDSVMEDELWDSTITLDVLSTTSEGRKDRQLIGNTYYQYICSITGNETPSTTYPTFDIHCSYATMNRHNLRHLLSSLGTQQAQLNLQNYSIIVLHQKCVTCIVLYYLHCVGLTIARCTYRAQCTTRNWFNCMKTCPLLVFARETTTEEGSS